MMGCCEDMAKGKDSSARRWLERSKKKERKG